MLIETTEQDRSRTFLSCFMPQVLSLQSNKIIHLGSSPSVFPSHMSLHFQRIVKTSNMRSWFPFLISEHLVMRQQELSWTARCCPCPGPPFPVTVPSIPTSAQRPAGVGAVHILPTPHSASPGHPPSHQLCWPTDVSPLREILPRALFSSTTLIKYSRC